MPTTCPNCGTRSPASAESCRNCGGGLYRLKHAASTTPAFSVNLRFSRMSMLITTSLVILSAGAATTVFGRGTDNAGQQQASHYESPAPVSTPSALPAPSSPEPTKKPQHKAKPMHPAPQPSTPTAEPTQQSPIDEIPPEVRRMLEDGGITLGPDGDSVTMDGWYVDRDGTVRPSSDG